jgi:hypothetical protein
VSVGIGHAGRETKGEGHRGGVGGTGLEEHREGKTHEGGNESSQEGAGEVGEGVEGEGEGAEVEVETALLQWVGELMETALCPAAGTGASRKTGALELLSVCLDVWVPLACERIDARLHTRTCFALARGGLEGSRKVAGLGGGAEREPALFMRPLCRCDAATEAGEPGRAPRGGLGVRAGGLGEGSCDDVRNVGSLGGLLCRARVVDNLLAALFHTLDRVRVRAAQLLVRISHVLPALGLTAETAAELVGVGGRKELVGVGRCW